MATTDRVITLQQFLKLPEQKPAVEFAEGRVQQKMSPKGEHSVLQAALIKTIDGFAEPLRLARAFPELRTTFAGRSYVPDVSVYRWERIPVGPDGRVVSDFFDPPDIAIEILSAGQNVGEQTRKCEWYVGNGVPIALLVLPDEESLRRFAPGSALQTLSGGDTIDLEAVLPGFRLTARELFDSLRLR